MEDKKIDRRVLKTKKAIRNAFAELLNIKSIDEITVTDVAEYADISRKTFYSYYNGIWEIMSSIETEITDSLGEMINDIEVSDYKKAPFYILEKLADIINSDVDFYGNLLLKSDSSLLFDKIHVVVREKIKEIFFETYNASEESINFVLRYSVDRLLTLFKDWYMSDRKIPLEKLISDFNVLLFSGINGYFKIE